jgi:hypothetical protein
VGDTISITDTDTGVGRVYQTYELQTVRDLNTSVRYHIHHREKHRHRCRKSLSNIRVKDSQGHKHKCEIPYPSQT